VNALIERKRGRLGADAFNSFALIRARSGSKIAPFECIEHIRPPVCGGLPRAFASRSGAAFLLSPAFVLIKTQYAKKLREFRNLAEIFGRILSDLELNQLVWALRLFKEMRGSVGTKRRAFRSQRLGWSR